MSPSRPTSLTGPWRHPALAILAASMLGWATVFGTLVWLRHERFTSFGFDLGIYDQALWLLAHGEEAFVTVRGLHVFGHHANLAFFLLVPSYLLGAGPHFLNLLQITVLALAPLPVFLLVHHRTGRPWLALSPAVAVLIHPTAAGLSWELFHPDTMAITSLLAAYLAAVRERWGWFTAFLLLTLAWKEDLALAGFMLGLLLFLRGHRRIGAVTAIGSATWFLVAIEVLIPSFNPAGPFYAGTMFGELGGSPAEVLRATFTRPELVWERMTDPRPLSYLLRLSGPFGLALPLVAPGTLFLGVPQLAVNLLTEFPYTRRADLHYAAIPFSALALATAEGVSRLHHRRAGVGLAAALVVVASALAGTVAWGQTPLELEDQTRNHRRVAMEEALERVPDRVSVTATYNLVPHLAHRPFLYEWPNPWRVVNWGVRGESPHHPDRVEWLVIDRRVVRPENRDLLEGLLVGEFTVRYEADDVLVAERS